MDENGLEITQAQTRRAAPEDADMALAFCRECLGWPDAYRTGKYILENKHRPELNHATGRIHGFQIDPQDFGNVMNGVKEWCDIHAVPLSLSYSVGQKDAWRVGIAPDAEARGGDPSDALLRACLQGTRSLKSPCADIDAPPQRRNPAILDNPWGNIGENGPTALAFCQECRGWAKARLVNDCGYVYISEKLADYPVEPRSRDFHFNENHLQKVMKAVVAWCEARVISFGLDYFPSGSASDCWRAHVGEYGEAYGELASAALMAACLAAHRKNGVIGLMGGLLERAKK